MSALLLLDADRKVLGEAKDTLLVEGVSFDAERDGTPAIIALSDGATLTDLVQVGPTVYLRKGETFVWSLDLRVSEA